MNIVSLENVSKNYGFKPLFESVTLGLEDRDKVGIIGANGSGKTTLVVEINGVSKSYGTNTIEKELILAASDAGRVHQLFTEQQSLESQLETDMARWAELAENK